LGFGSFFPKPGWGRSSGPGRITAAWWIPWGSIFQELIRISDKFLWSVENCEILPRRREPAQHPRIELICDEEISAAIKCVLRRQFATTLEDLIMESSRLLGFQTTHENISNRIKAIIERTVERKDLQNTRNGRIDFV